MIGSGEEARRAVGAQDLGGMRIEGDGDRIAAGGASVREGAEENGTMTEVDAVEDSDGKEDGAG